jgi:hypothetical protein
VFLKIIVSKEKIIAYPSGGTSANGSFMDAFMQTMVDHLLLWSIHG